MEVLYDGDGVHPLRKDMGPVEVLWDGDGSRSYFFCPWGGREGGGCSNPIQSWPGLLMEEWEGWALLCDQNFLLGHSCPSPSRGILLTRSFLLEGEWVFFLPVPVHHGIGAVWTERKTENITFPHTTYAIAKYDVATLNVHLLARLGIRFKFTVD